MAQGTTLADRNELRAELARGLSAMYASEVPKYGHLVDATNRINESSGDARDAGRLGTERHGAVRLGSFAELAQIAQLFGLFGMHAVGYYDLRTAATPLPIVSTAFRPIRPGDMAASPFRMFTSTLVADDERFFSAELSAEIEQRIAARQLCSPELSDLIESSLNDGVRAKDAERFVALSIDVFRLNDEPIDAAWYGLLDAVSPVASDIAAAAGTHLNHLTPRVADIVALHDLLSGEGVTMIDRIQGPPAWEGPDVLLRQTSFRALDEPRRFVTADGRVIDGTVRVRFGEVEQRGIALTRQGRAKVEEATAADGDTATELGARLASSFEELVASGDAYANYRPGRVAVPDGEHRLEALAVAGAVIVEPITYEDFLPASAAGIFASNLAHAGAVVEDTTDRVADAQRLRTAVGTLHDPYALYEAQQAESISATAAALGIDITA